MLIIINNIVDNNKKRRIISKIEEGYFMKWLKIVLFSNINVVNNY